MNSTGQQTIVVGVSGSSASVTALRWAADEAQRRHALLRVVRSWDPAFRAPYAAVGGLPTADQQRAAASRELAAAMHAAFGPATPDDVVAELAEGLAERTLVERSAAADLLVLGATAPPTPAVGAVGAVVRTCLSRAHCPVVVVGADAASGRDLQLPGQRPALRSLPAMPSLRAARQSAG
jgi:nucleotide-binding universal stress UspA family protein